MLTPRAQLEFDERYYRWALDDWRREIDEGFPFLTTLQGLLQKPILRLMNSLDGDERWLLAKALVKRGREDGVLTRWGDPFTDEDRQFEQLFLDMVSTVVSQPIILDLKDARARKRVFPKLNRRKFRRHIVTALSPVLGERYENWGGGEWRYNTPVGPWQIMTYIDAGGSIHQLCYEHDIIASEHVYLTQNINLLRWLGIGSQTEWQGVGDSDAEATAKALAKIVGHFMSAVPKLLEGLTPD